MIAGRMLGVSTAEMTDHVALELDLTVDSTPGQDGFRATIEVPGLRLSVEAVEPDLMVAMTRAAERCADRLGELGFSVTAADVLGALEDTGEAGVDGPDDRVWN